MLAYFHMSYSSTFYRTTSQPYSMPFSAFVGSHNFHVDAGKCVCVPVCKLKMGGKCEQASKCVCAKSKYL